MENLPNIDELRKALDAAEKFLEDNKDDNSNKIKRKRKKVNNAVEKAYLMLNKKEYTRKDVDKNTDDIWIALMDDDNYLALIIFFFGFMLSGALIFTVFQAYSFFQENLNPEIKEPDLTQEISDLIDVQYTENNIVNMYDMYTVSDEEGLKTTPEEFTISNDSSKVPSLQYSVNYQVNLVPMNSANAKLINLKYIKYRYTYKDSNTGKTHISKIGVLSDLNVNPDGSLQLVKASQSRDSKTDFKVNFWISSIAPNSEQSSTYTFAFKVNASIAKN